MPNTTLTADVIAAEAVTILENECSMANLVYRGYEDEFVRNYSGYKPGETVYVRRPADFTVRTAWLEMALDHDTGEMRGVVLAGRHKGAALESLSIEQLLDLLAEADDETRALLLPYLDRRDPGWREHAQGDAAAGRPAASSGKMSEQEAYQILGLEAGASADDIGRAHRTLMKKFHPDQGGSTYLAARINEAKEILLRRHRCCTPNATSPAAPDFSE